MLVVPDSFHCVVIFVKYVTLESYVTLTFYQVVEFLCTCPYA